MLWLVRRALDLLSPALCAACDEPHAGSSPFCATCEKTFRPGPLLEAGPGGVPLAAAAVYEGALATAIRRLKYEDRSDLAPSLAALLDGAQRATGSSSRALFVPVPSHPARLAERGYNPAALLARELARRTGSPWAPRALVRVRGGASQARARRGDRLGNVQGAFVPRKRLDHRLVVLVDDVVTTGATMLAATEALRIAGADLAGIIALARAVRAE